MGPAISKEQVVRMNEMAWEEAAPIHRGYYHERLLTGFRQPGYSCISERKRDALMAHGLQGKAVFQPCCNNGRDMLSMKNLGAGRCVGFDFSGGFIGQGKELAAAGGICCELVQADIYKLGHEYDGQFDIAYITSGTLCCLPDLDGFFAVVSRLMRAGAWMLMEEIHPIMDMFSVEPSKRLRWLRFEYSYFSSEPRRVRRGLDYYRKKAYAAESCYFFHHKLADVMQAILNNAMRIESFAEHDTDTTGGRFKRLMKRRSRLPLSYTITAVRC